MQRLARELNLSETVFVLPADVDHADVGIRIFTPTAELPFAGHPVLGAAFVVGEGSTASRLALATAAGVIPVELRRQDGQIVFGEMEQPIPVAEPFERGAEILAAVGVERSDLPVQAYRNGPVHVFVKLASEQAVADLHPDLTALATFGECCISCFAGAGAHYKTRMFAPLLGVPEDPATGSAAGPLAVHLARHGFIGFGERIEIRQGAEIGRPSVLHARVEGSIDRVQRVAVGGAAVIVARGEYQLS
jgi:trans-2,3-dihydro-3-hydroxyanthranilate isomerase